MKKKKSHKKKHSKKHAASAKSNEFNKTFHLAEVNDGDIDAESDNMEYFEWFERSKLLFKTILI